MRREKIYLILVTLIILIGAIVILIINFNSFLAYLAIIFCIFVPAYLYGRRIEESNQNYVNEITDRIKDSSDKGVNKFPIGIIIIDEDKNIEWANNFIYKHLNVQNIIGENILEVIPEIAIRR